MPKFRTKIQNSKMFGIAAKLGLTHDDLKEMAFDVSNERTEKTSELFIHEADKIIARLESYTAQKKDVSPRTVRRRRQQAGVPQIITPKHKGKIERLLNQRNITADGYQSLCRRMLKHDEPRTTKEANKIIEALKAMIARDAKKKEAA